MGIGTAIWDALSLSSPTSPQEKRPRSSAPPPLSLTPRSTPTPSPSTPSPPATPATHSSRMLRDAEVLSFLTAALERVRASRVLPRDAVDRLDAMQAQAAVDGCAVLGDIVEYLEAENVRVWVESRARAAGAGPSAAAVEGSSAAMTASVS